MPTANNYQEAAEFVEELVIFQNRSASVYSEFIARPEAEPPRVWSGSVIGEQNCIAVINTNMGWFSRNYTDPYKAGIYVVYSYGSHYPMFIYDLETAQWFVNTDNYSPTTIKQRSTLRPKGVDMVELGTYWMKILVNTGSYRGMAQMRTEGAAA